MIVVNAVIETTPENIEAMKDAISVMEQKSRLEEGCHDYTFSVELSNPEVIRITEKWESMSALEAHFKVPHMADFQQVMAAHPPRSFSPNFYEVTEVPPPAM